MLGDADKFVRASPQRFVSIQSTTTSASESESESASVEVDAGNPGLEVVLRGIPDTTVTIQFLVPPSPTLGRRQQVHTAASAVEDGLILSKNITFGPSGEAAVQVP